MSKGYFITGTGTGVGKTLVSCALLHAFAAQGNTVIGMKPVAAGCENGKWVDVELLAAASNVIAPREQINPYALVPPIAPHIAASRAGIDIDIQYYFSGLPETGKNCRCGDCRGRRRFSRTAQ